MIFTGTHNYIDAKLPSLSKSLTDNLLLVLFGSWAIALLAQIAIPLGFTPIPITGQTFGILLIGALYGGKRSLITTIFYVVQGAFGLPFFAKGASGFAVLLGPTGGYLLGMIIAATVMGYLAEKKYDQAWKSSLPLFFIGHLIIFCFGLAWLGNFVGYQNVISLGLLPFLPGLIIKTILAASITSSIQKN
ncbi:MAG: biotin transporter BioY [Bacteriovoracaceae bacterium]|nr:biotin transporter BioY [Bacteriovoracaceae bacterium]